MNRTLRSLSVFAALLVAFCASYAAVKADCLSAGGKPAVEVVGHGWKRHVYSPWLETANWYVEPAGNDVPGFHGALRAIDAAVREWVQRLDRERDLLVLTADHGCDPTMPGTDHTREHAPLVASFAGHDGRRHDGPFADVGASVLRWLAGRETDALPGTPFT